MANKKFLLDDERGSRESLLSHDRARRNKKGYSYPFLATLAIVLAFGMAVSGCSKGSKSGGEAEGGKGGEPGTLTITGLPEEEFFVMVVGMDKNVSSIGNVAVAQDGSLVMGTQPKNVGNVFELILHRDGKPWTDSGKRQVVLVKAIGDAAWRPLNQAMRTATVNFSKGSATVKYSSFTLLTK